MRFTWALRVGFLFLILPMPFLLSRYGYDWIDTFYHLMHYRGTPCNMGFIVFLYPFLGRLWGELAGTGLLSYKMLDALILVLMHVGVPFVLCRAASERSRLLMASAGILLSSAIAFYMLGYDSFSCLTVALVVMTAWRHLQGGGVATALLLGILTALLSAIRFPGIVMAFPIGLLMLSMAAFRQLSWRTAALHVTAFAAALSAAYILLFQAYAIPDDPSASGGGIGGMYRYIRASLSAETSANHPLKPTLLRYLRDGVRIAMHVSLMALLFLGWQRIRGRVARKGWWDAAVLLLYGIGLWFFVRPWGGWYFPTYLLVASWGFLLGGAAVWLSWREGRHVWMQIALFLLLSSFVPMAGSNTGMIKTALVLTYAVPVFLHMCLRLLPAPAGRVLRGAAILSLFFCLYYKAFVGPTLMDGRLPELTATVDHPRLAGVFTTPVRKAAVEELLAVVARHRGRSEDGSVLYYGTESYLFRYLDPAPAYFRSNYTMYYHVTEDAHRFGAWVAGRDRRPLVVLVFGYPETVRGLDGREVEAALLRRGYAIAQMGGFYKVYAPVPTPRRPG